MTLVKSNTVKLTTVHSLKSICIYYIARNLNNYIDNLYLLPANVKNKIVRHIVHKPLKNHVALITVMRNLVNVDTRQMDFSEIQIDDELLTTLTVCKNLTQLTLSNSGLHTITSDGFVDVLRDFKELVVFVAPNNKAINLAVIKVLVENCKNLGSLDVSGCGNFTDDCMVELGKLTNMLGLKISRTNITNKGLIALSLGESKTKIKELHLDCCRHIDQVALISVFENCPKLETLMFNNSTMMNGKPHFSFDPPDNKKLKHVTWSIYW